MPRPSPKLWTTVIVLLLLSLVMQPYEGKRGEAKAEPFILASILAATVWGASVGVIAINDYFDGSVVATDAETGIKIRKINAGPLAGQYKVEDGNTKYIVSTQSEGYRVLQKLKTTPAH